MIKCIPPTTLFLVMVIILIGGGVLFFQKKQQSNISCTLEAKLCPDGSRVGRIGPACEFAPCPAPADQSDTSSDQACTIYVIRQTVLYQRPQKDADMFGQADAGESIQAGGKTEQGWIGFDPASAQAPNVGPFRLRWFAPDAPIELIGNCQDLKVWPSLPAKTCFIMAQTDIAIHTLPDASSTIVDSLHFGDYIEAIAKSGTGYPFWAKVQSPEGSLPAGTKGWIASDDINFNGECDTLPTQ